MDCSKVDDRITNLTTTKIPRVLWHYTSIDAFKKIVESKQIFATEVRYLNDRSEFLHVKEIADLLLSDMPDPKTKLDRGALDLARRIVELSFETASQVAPEVFVASFTAAEDQLSQWRAYSYGSSGVSLGFDLTGFRPNAGIGVAACFAPCIYRTEDKKLLLRTAWASLAKLIISIGKGHSSSQKVYDAWKRGSASKRDWIVAMGKERKPPSKGQIKLLSRLLRDTLVISGLSKHESFKEEEEWRLVLAIPPSTSVPHLPRQFRSKPTTLVPYIAYPLCGTGKSLPLTEVILGPGSDENAVRATEIFLKDRKLNAHVRLSAAPYKIW